MRPLVIQVARQIDLSPTIPLLIIKQMMMFKDQE